MIAPAAFAFRSHVPFTLLDGAIGTQLKLRGVDVAARLDDSDLHDDYWSGKALLTDPAAVTKLAEDYLHAGADIITTNTFRVNGPTVSRLGLQVSAEELLRQAVDLARLARELTGCAAAIGASIGPVEYNASRASLAERHLRAVHEATIAALLNVGVDILLPETFATILEATIVSSVASQSGSPFMVSLTLQGDGRLPSGDALESAAEAVLRYSPEAILVNHCPIPVAAGALPRLAKVLAGTGVMYGLRPHLEKATEFNLWTAPGNCPPARFAEDALRWLELGATVIGGCCGTTPEHIGALAAVRLHIGGGVT